MSSISLQQYQMPENIATELNRLYGADHIFGWLGAVDRYDEAAQHAAILAFEQESLEKLREFQAMAEHMLVFSLGVSDSGSCILVSIDTPYFALPALFHSKPLRRAVEPVITRA